MGEEGAGKRGSEVEGKEPPVGRKEMSQWRRRTPRWVTAPAANQGGTDSTCDGRGERRASHGAERADNSVGRGMRRGGAWCSEQVNIVGGSEAA